MKNQQYKNTIWKYYAFVFLRDFFFISAVLVPFFTKWGHISLVQVQLLQSWFMLWSFILEVPTGAIADYFGKKYSLALGALVVTIAALIYGSFPNFYIFLFCEFLFAMGLALTSGADSALLYDSLKEVGKEEESKKIFGKAHSFKLWGLLISAPIGSIIASKLGLNAPLILSAIPFLLASIIAISIREPKYKEQTKESKRYLDIVKKGFQFFKQNKAFRLLTLDAILVSAAAYFVIWFYQPLFMNIKTPIIYFGYFHAFLVLIEILIASNFSLLEKWFGFNKYLKISAIITSLSFILVAIYPNFYTIISFLIFAGGFGLTRIELMLAHMNKLIPSSNRATILSSVSMFETFILVILNPIIGFLADKSLRYALLTISILPIVTLFLKTRAGEQLTVQE